MVGMTIAVIAILTIWICVQILPDNFEKYKSFSLIGYVLAIGYFAVPAFNGMFFYAEPGFKYHVRTITGQEKMISDTGYNL